MDDYKEHLRRLTVHDDALVETILSEETASPAFALDQRTAALVRVAATIAVDAAPSSFQHAVALALAAGATNAESTPSVAATNSTVRIGRINARRGTSPTF